MSFIEEQSSFQVVQRKELSEALIGWEKTNRYDIHNLSGGVVGHAQEEKRNWFLRNLLGGTRPFGMNITTEAGTTLLHLDRPFRWFFAFMNVYDGIGNFIGSVQQKFAWLNRHFQLQDRNDQVVLEIQGKIWKPWTFQVLKNGTEVALISKQWSGLGKELFSKADNFSLTFNPSCPMEDRPLITATLFLIDFCFFERKN